RREAWGGAGPPRGQLAPLHLDDLGGGFRKLFAVGGKQRLPATARLRAAPANPGLEPLHDALRHQGLGLLWPAVGAADHPKPTLPQGLTVSGRRIDEVRRAVADVAVEDDERGPALGLAEDGERILDALNVVGVPHPQHVPLIAEEARRDVLREGDPRLAFNGDVVVVIDPAEVVEAEMAGQRGSLGTDALHQTAIAAHGVNV